MDPAIDDDIDDDGDMYLLPSAAVAAAEAQAHARAAAAASADELDDSEEDNTFMTGFGAIEDVNTGYEYAHAEKEDPVWFHGPLSRSKAEDLLLKPDVEQGQFLIRESESSKGDFTLSLRNGKRTVRAMTCTV